MTHGTDTRIRIVLLAVALAAIGVSIGVANAELSRPVRFAVLATLGFVAAATGSAGLDIIQGYSKRRPLRLRWGKPRAGLGASTASPDRVLPDNWRFAAPLQIAPLTAAVAGSAAATVVSGAIAYALAGSATADGRGLFFYLLFGLAAWQTGRFALRMFTRKSALTVTADSATLGLASGYVPALVIPRHEVDALEIGAAHNILAFITPERRYEVSTAMMDATVAAQSLAGLWPDKPWHELSPDAIKTSVGGTD